MCSKARFTRLASALLACVNAWRNVNFLNEIWLEKSAADCCGENFSS